MSDARSGASHRGGQGWQPTVTLLGFDTVKWPLALVAFGPELLTQPSSYPELLSSSMDSWLTPQVTRQPYHRKLGIQGLLEKMSLSTEGSGLLGAVFILQLGNRRPRCLGD